MQPRAPLLKQTANTPARHRPPHQPRPLLPQEKRMKSSWSEPLSWKKGRNKHNLNYHSRRVVACCSGIKQASRQVAGLKYRQALKQPAAASGRGGAASGQGPAFVFPPRAQTGQEPPTAAADKAQAAPRELDFCGSSCPRHDQASPFPSEQTSLLRARGRSGTAAVGRGHLGRGARCPASGEGPERLPACCCRRLVQGEGAHPG